MGDGQSLSDVHTLTQTLFLRRNAHNFTENTWHNQLTREFAIKVSHYPALGVVMLNYDQVASDMTQGICRECRALILSDDFNMIVSRSFPKFFNVGEPNGADIEAGFDWNDFAAQEKLDGTLICLYHWRGAWQIATKGRADASGQVNVNPLTFAELTKKTAGEQFKVGSPSANF